VARPEASQLAAPKSGVERQRPESDQSIVGERIEEGPSLLGAPHLHLLRLTFRHTSCGGRIGDDEIPADGIGERSPKDAVRQLHGCHRQPGAVEPLVEELAHGRP